MHAMLSTVLNILAIEGISIAITRTYIFEKFRESMSMRSEFFGELFSCTVCTSFWTGCIFAVFTGVWQLPFISMAVSYLFTKNEQ